MDMVRRGYRTDFGPDMVAQFAVQLFIGYDIGIQCDVAVNSLSLNIMRKPDDRRLGHQIVQYQRAFHFGGAHSVTRHIDDIIDTARYPVIIILVTAAASS